MGSKISAVSLLFRKQDDSVEAVVIALVLVVSRPFVESMARGTFAEKDQLIETLVFDRAHPPFGESVEVGRLRWEFERCNARGLKECIEGLGEPLAFGILQTPVRRMALEQ